MTNTNENIGIKQQELSAALEYIGKQANVLELLEAKNGEMTQTRGEQSEIEALQALLSNTKTS